MHHIKYLALILSIILLTSNLAYSKTDSPGILLEANPDGLAFNPYTGVAVVANEKSSSVSIVDLATQEVLASIPVGKAPRGVAIDREMNIAVVGSSHDDVITVIDLNTYEALADIPVGKAPEGIAIDEVTHTVFVANHKDNTVSVIDLQTLTNLGEIAVGHEPIDVAINSELGYALVVNEKDWGVSVIDIETFEVTGSVPVGKKPQAIDINPDTHLAVVTNEKDNSISVIDLSNWQVTNVPIGKHPIDVAVNELDNTALVISDEDRLLLVVDLDSNTVTRSYELNKLPKGIAVNPYTNVAGVVDDKTDSLTLFQLPSPVPHIEYVEPSPLLRGSYNVALTIKGSRFMNVATVSIESGIYKYAPEPTFIDFHTLEVGIPTEMLESTGMYELTVTNPEPEGGFDSVELAVVNPRPQISFLDPAEVVAGVPGLNLGVFGDGFFGDTKFYVDGAERDFDYIEQSKVELDFNSTELEVGSEKEIAAYNSPPGGGISDTAVFTVLNPVPVLTSISPTAAEINTSVTLTLSGEGFVKTSQVLFNGQQLSVTYVDSNTLQVEIPPVAVPGGYSVEVVSPTPGGGTSNTVVFTALNPVPVLTSISPTEVEINTFTTLVLSGENFVNTSQVVFDGQPLETAYVNGTELTAQVPVSLIPEAGTYSVTVVTPAPGGGESEAATFTALNPVPVLTSITPTEAEVDTSVTLTISGEGFVNTSTVEFNGQPLETTYVDGNTLQAELGPVAEAGDYPVTVTTPEPGGGESEVATFTVLNPVPVLTSISPTEADVDTSVTLTISGEGFVNASQVVFNEQSLETTYVDGNTLQAELGSVTEAGNYPVKVATPAPGGGESASIILPVLSADPVLISISPPEIDAEPEWFKYYCKPKKITLHGSNFTNGSVARIDNWSSLYQPQTKFINSTVLEAYMPCRSLRYSVLPIHVKNPNGSVSEILNLKLIPPKPVITSVAEAVPDTIAFFIHGDNYLPYTKFFLNGEQLYRYYLSGDNKVKVRRSNYKKLTEGEYELIAVSGNAVSEIFRFTVEYPKPVPVLTSISPTEAEINTTNTLTLSGEGFFNTSQVMFNGQPLETTYVDSNTLQAVLGPVAVGGDYLIKVINPPPGGGESEAAVFTALNPVPVLTSLSPTEAEIVTSVTLTLTGEKFVNTSQVMFDGQPLETAYVNGTELTATVSSSSIPESGTYSITVVNPAPGGGESEAAAFTVQKVVPVVTSAQELVYPPRRLETGYPRGIELTGENFIPGTRFYLNGEQVSRYFRSDTSVWVTLTFPSAGTYSITVSNDGVTFSEPYYIEVYNPVPEIWFTEPGGNKYNIEPIQKDSLPVQILIRGWGIVFLPYSTLLLDGNPIEFTDQKFNELYFTLPADIPMGTHTLQVVNPAPGGGSSNVYELHVCQMPGITSVEPNNIFITDSPVEVTAYGTGFDETSEIVVYYTRSSIAYSEPLYPSDIYFGSDDELSYMRMTLPTQSTSSLGDIGLKVYNPWCGKSYSKITVSSPPPHIVSATPQELDMSTYEDTPIIVDGEYFVNNALQAHIIDSSGNEMRVNINRTSNSEVTVSLLPWWCLEYHPYGWCTKANVSSYNLEAGDYTLRISTYYGSDEVPITLTQPLELDLAITYPPDGASLDGDRTLVTGTIASETADLSKVDITVNGVRAYVYGNEWAVNDVPLVAGANIINAVAEAEGYDNTVAEQITVNATGGSKPITLVTSARSGLAPLEAYFFVASPIANSITGYSIDFEGDGIVDYTGATFDDISHIYTAEGLYYPSVTVTDGTGNTYTDRLAIAVLPLADMKTIFERKWNEMRDALLNGDIEGALELFAYATRDQYQQTFTELGTELGSIMSSFEGFKLYTIYEGVAEGGLLRTESGGVYSYPITFIRDENGIWRIYGL
jgi:YVTN family beta-propeller protein